MRTSNKKAPKQPASKKQPTTGSLAVPIEKPEPAYININEGQAELAAKNRLLWIIVAIFAVILAIFWLVVLRANIQKETAEINFDQIGEQIAKSLARFDTEIKNRTAPKEINAEDLAAIRFNLEEKIKNNPDSSLWPTKELASLKISLQIPADWMINLQDKRAVITFSSTTEREDFGKLEINVKSNQQKLKLTDWLKKNNLPNGNYTVERPLFSATSTLESLIYDSSAATPKQLDKIVYLNNPAGKTVYEIKITAGGDLDFYRPLTEEIVRTIKILN